jgi:two-component system osmolarity sensor histidine kinase EnvZ
VVLIRKSQISRALINILDNAKKFADNIYINSLFDGSKWIISIEDDGPGTNLSQEQLVKPFTKGGRATESRNGSRIIYSAKVNKT